ncbi:hypothetical protein LTR37_004764 [Vermiconidia calcicola]|uniref:Uncharacterized protein n=1 Tax=Vermiconidia calcicola TaxID=1690605 RepID=A0ACC3NMQ6_9PEZI|nr:hypothetical protein LTR37_004764 [Vermiconidia calcicola]
MEEDPKDHDFDQREDGPMQRPTVQTDTTLPQRTRSDEGVGPKDMGSPNSRYASSPMSSPMRHGTQMSGTAEHPQRRSTQMSRSASRPSRDFDQRRDGPFGRPSITMERRRSSMERRRSSGTRVASMPAVPPLPGASEEAVEDQHDTQEQQAPSDHVPPSVETMQSTTDAAFEPEPPPLNYTLYTRKMSIFIFWSIILIDSIAMPIVLYFCLWYLTDLSPNTVFSIVTAALGGASILEYFLRFWRLWKKSSTCRVIGARRMYLDWFHWNFTLAWLIVMVELIVGSVPEHPYIRLLSMPLATMCFVFGTELMIVDILRYFEVPAPCRMSSIPKGAQLRPGIYSIIEDICAVDGSGGTEFRENLNRRYEASHMFRSMLRRLGEFWAFGAQATAVVTTILVYTLGEDAAYVVGWSLPFVWAGFATWFTIWYVRRKLGQEKKAWTEEMLAKSNA